MGVKFLALYLDAPLQSWGYESKFDYRTTFGTPTRSGVVGLLCAACGIDRLDTQGLAEINRVAISVYAFELGPRLTDYQTVGGGYDSKEQRQSIVPKASGAVGDTVQTWRDYLEGSRFGVAVGGEEALVGRIAAAVQNPVWGVWLGRKACVPAEPLYAGVFESEGAAIEALRQRERARRPERGGEAQIVRVVKDAATFADGTDTLMDNPLDFASRKFAPRRIALENKRA